MQRVGLANFMEAIDVEPIPEMIRHPRENPYVFYEEYFEEVEEGDEYEEYEEEEEEYEEVGMEPGAPAGP